MLIAGCLVGTHEHIPRCHKQRRDHRADHKAVDTKQRNAADGRHQHEVVGHLGFLTDQQGPQDVVDQADHEDANEDQHSALPYVASGQKVDGYRAPDQCCSDGWQQRQESHQHRPQQGSLHAEKPEGQPADRALGNGHRDVALDGRAGHSGEFIQQKVGMPLVQRHGFPHRCRQGGAVAQQKEQQVQHDKKADQEIEGVLPDRQCLRGDKLASLRGPGRNPGLPCRHVAEIEALQQRDQPTRGRVENLLKIVGKVDLPGADALRDGGNFLHQRNPDHGQRQDHDHQTNRQRCQGGQRAPCRHFSEQQLE